MRQVNVLLAEKTINELREIADMEGLPYTVMVRNWIVRKVREYASATAAKPEADAVANTSHKEVPADG